MEWKWNQSKIEPRLICICRGGKRLYQRAYIQLHCEVPRHQEHQLSVCAICWLLIKYRDLHNLFRSGHKSLHGLAAYLECWFSEISIAWPRSLVPSRIWSRSMLRRSRDDTKETRDPWVLEFRTGSILIFATILGETEETNSSESPSLVPLRFD